MTSPCRCLVCGSRDICEDCRRFNEPRPRPQHRRKPWWPSAREIVIIKVKDVLTPRWHPSPNTARFEAAAISLLEPWASIAPASRRALA